MTEWILGLTCACALLALGLALLALRQQRARYDDLLTRLDELTERSREASTALEPSPAEVPAQDYLITALATSSPDDSVSAARPSPQFVPNATLRETVILGAAWVHGVRRALDPATRNRIRFEMRREIKRSRRTRKQEMKQALREFRARERAGLTREEVA